jgi:glycosyltransferase involved in cell wall biosynthesis
MAAWNESSNREEARDAIIGCHADNAMPRTYRVLAVTNMWPNEADPSFGSFVQDQLESLRPLGVDYDVLFMNGRQSRWNYLMGIGELWRRVRAKHYDLVHAHFGLSGWVARFQLGVPLVITFHGDDVLGRPAADGHITPTGRFFQASSFLLAPLASAVIVQNRQMRRALRLESAEIIPCGIDLELFRPMDRDEACRTACLDQRKKYVLFPYNPQEQRKRFDLIEAAVAKAREQMPQLEVLQVRRKPHSEMPLYMNAADVLVMASVIEGSPLAVREAMATNLPVVSVDVGDAVDLISEGDGNHIVPRQLDALAAKIIAVCSRGERSHSRERLGPYSMPATAKRILDVYSRVARS